MTTVQGIPKKFSRKKILSVVKKKFACNGTIVHDEDMGEVIQLQGDQRKHMQEFLVDKEEGLELDPKTIKASFVLSHTLSCLRTHYLTAHTRLTSLFPFHRSTVSKPAMPLRPSCRLG